MTPLQWLMAAIGFGCLFLIHWEQHHERDYTVRRPWQPLGWRELRRMKKEEGTKEKKEGAK